MYASIEPSWSAALATEIAKPYFTELHRTIEQRYATTTVYPPPQDLFRAFWLTPIAHVQVVILGQDPYHGQGQAHGLAFSVPREVAVPPSLRNILTEVTDDIGGSTPTHGDLTHWAQQGVLLLNSTLTVEANLPGSHQRLGWETFTDKVIETIATTHTHVVFHLWGAFAGAKRHYIDETKHLVCTAPHPSPLSAYRGFFGTQPCSRTNAYLLDHGRRPIDWRLP